MARPLQAKVTSWLVSTFTGGDPRTVVQTLLAEKRTGQLTIHISQGGVGSIEWRERGHSLTADEVANMDIPKIGLDNPSI